MRKRRQPLSHVLTLRIAPTTYERIGMHANDIDISVAELIRRIIATYLEGQQDATSPE